ncbi:MAG: hypothetical protein GF393_07580 [Armatimonadia bacterium]|nr:hypothetical protein [Armatimonadia bacterium]
MFRRAAFLVATTLAVSFCHIASAQADQITGIVNVDGEPAAGAQVVIVRYTAGGLQTTVDRPPLDAPASDLITYTAEDGGYALPWPADAEWVLVAARAEGDRLNSAQMREPGEANLYLGGQRMRQRDPIQWEAKIVDGDGNPQAGVTLDVVRINSSLGESTLIPWPEQFSAVSAADGTLGMTLPGYFHSAWLRLRDHRGQMVERLMISPGGPHEIEYWPREPVVVDGTVVDLEGTAVEGATVRCYGDPGEPGVATSDAEGYFRLQYDDIAWRNILAWKDGVGFDATVVHSGMKRRRGGDGSREGRDMLLQLLPRGAIIGAITDEQTGDPIPGVMISANPSYVYEARTGTPGPIPHKELHRISEQRGRSATTDEHGRYRLETDAGPALIHLSVPGYVQSGSLRGMRTTIPPGDEREQDFVMKPLYPVFMRVWHEGERLQGYHLKLTSEDRPRTHQWKRPEDADWDTVVATEEPGYTFTITPVNVGNGEFVCDPETVTVTEEPQTIDVYIRELQE